MKKKDLIIYPSLVCATAAVALLALGSPNADYKSAFAAAPLPVLEGDGDAAEENTVEKAKFEAKKQLEAIKQEASFKLDATDHSYFNLFLETFNQKNSEIQDGFYSTAQEVNEAKERALAELRAELEKQETAALERALTNVETHVNSGIERASNEKVKEKLAQYKEQLKEEMRNLKGNYATQYDETQVLSQSIYSTLAQYEKEVAKEELQERYNDLLAADNEKEQHYSEQEKEQLRKLLDDALAELDGINTEHSAGGTGADGEKIDAALKNIKRISEESKTALEKVEKSEAPKEDEVIAPAPGAGAESPDPNANGEEEEDDKVVVPAPDGTTPDTKPGTGTGADTGTDTETDTGTESGAEPGAESTDQTDPKAENGAEASEEAKSEGEDLAKDDQPSDKDPAEKDSAENQPKDGNEAQPADGAQPDSTNKNDSAVGSDSLNLEASKPADNKPADKKPELSAGGFASSFLNVSTKENSVLLADNESKQKSAEEPTKKAKQQIKSGKLPQTSDSSMLSVAGIMAAMGAVSLACARRLGLKKD